MPSQVYSGTFSATGPMSTPRMYHTATLLSDGRVLVAGGNKQQGPIGGLASAELFDPKTNTFSPTGSMAYFRYSHTATLLADGRVLVAGGVVGPASMAQVDASAELYDPKTGTFSPTGSMSTPRTRHTATLLSDGRVLIVGGQQLRGQNETTYLASAEIYDPATGNFTPTGSMSDGRVWHTATLLSYGRVLITGGLDAPSAELYLPKTGAFSPTGSMSTTREYVTATLLSDGRVLFAGGYGHLASAELYDPKTGAFSPTGSMSTTRLEHTATLLSDGRVLVAGGQSGSESMPVASAELYDPKTGTFSPTGSMQEPRIMTTATLLSDGRVLIVGDQHYQYAELYS